VFLPGDAGFDAARKIWNAMIDRRPSIIVEASGVADVMATVGFAREQNLELAVRGGGHNVAGKAATDGGILLSLARMRSVQVDPAVRLARVAGGAMLGDFDHEAQAFGLAAPGGVVSTTGVAGLTLGGGFGWLARKHGLAADNLVSVDLVTADGRLVRASDEENADLFWALRGGGGNFGVAVNFTFRLHPVGPEVLFGPTLYCVEDAPEVLKRWRDEALKAPREVCVWADILTAPPFPFLPEQYHGKQVISVLQCFAGDVRKGEAALAPFRNLSAPIGDMVGPMPYAAAQQILDETYAFGARNYWASANYRALSDEAIDTAITLAEVLPTAESDILFCMLGGAIDEVAPDATAYPHRGIGFFVTPGARWRNPEDDGRCLAWIRRAQIELGRRAEPGAYVITEPDGRSRDAYGANYDRLAEIKATWDPGNLFRLNQNVLPKT
jgi:FAD/FMN-containing dehydrogenase